MQIQSAISRLVARQDLSYDDMTAVMRQIMSGNATNAQIAGLLVALQMKGETTNEITAAATVMRELATPVTLTDSNIVDTCGTGGDGACTFNVSTASAFVVAAAGGMVAKHGNRSISSRSGSADVLEAAGIKLDLSAEQVKACIETVGIGFLFAQNHHSAMKHAIGPRREMAIKTLFNLLGPLTNPAKAQHQVLGVFDPKWLIPMAEVLKNLGSRHALVVHSDDGLDEISISATTQIAELKQGQIKRYHIEPGQFDIATTNIDALKISSAQESLELILAIFQGKLGPARDIVTLNAGAAIYAADLTTTLKEGVERARTILSNGQAYQKLQDLIAYSHQC